MATATTNPESDPIRGGTVSIIAMIAGVIGIIAAVFKLIGGNL